MKRLMLVLVMVFCISGIVDAEDYHVMQMSNDDSTNQITVVFHIPVTDENNTVGHSYRDAVSESVGGGAFVSVYPATTGTELTNLQNGVLFEHAETVQVEDSLTLVQKRTIIDDRFTTLSSANGLNKLYKKRLAFFGLDRDVP